MLPNAIYYCLDGVIKTLKEMTPHMYIKIKTA